MPIEATRSLANTAVLVANSQRDASIKHKAPRMRDIRTSEDFYFGKVKPQLRIPFNVPVPVMSGFVDTLMSKIDDAPSLTYGHQVLADLKKARRITASFQNESTSKAPNARWPQKDRWEKKMAIFSGRGISKIFAESDPEYKSHNEVIDHYDFHAEPDGGGHLETHLFCGQDRVFRTHSQLKAGVKNGLYDAGQVALLENKAKNQDYKDSTDHEQEERLGRFRALQLDVEGNNYVGEPLFNLTEWYMTWKGQRWYMLWDPWLKLWIRFEPLREVFATEEYPFVSWATHEEAKVFWSKAPADDMRPVADSIHVLFNQELYNREKRNTGKVAYDPTVFEDPSELADWRPDGLVRANASVKRIEEGIYKFETPELNGTVDLISFMDSFWGQKSAVTPGSQGVAEADKKVGIFFGELQQVEDRLNLYNKSYSGGWEDKGLKYKDGLVEHLSKKQAINIIGTDGVEMEEELSREDLKTMRDLTIKIEGGASQLQEEEIKGVKQEKAIERILGSELLVAKTNGQWLIEQVLKLGEFPVAEAAKATNITVNTTDELLAEADEAIRDILKGKDPKINRGADTAFMQHITNFAIDQDLEEVIFNKLMDYSIAHAEIALENMVRKAGIAQAPAEEANVESPLLGPQGPAPEAPGAPAAPSPSSVASFSQKASQALRK